MRVICLSLLALHLARAAAGGRTPVDVQHGRSGGGIATVSSRRRGAETRLLRHDRAVDRAGTAQTDDGNDGHQTEVVGIKLERENTSQGGKAERWEPAAAIRGLDAQAETAPDPRDGHHLTLETLRVETRAGDDHREEDETTPTPPRNDWRTDHADEMGGGGDLPSASSSNSSSTTSAGIGVDGAGDDSGTDANVDVGGGGGDRDGEPLERCYSSPDADPSEGAWKECPGGEAECSPTRTTPGNWASEWGTDFHHCTALWAARHPGTSRPYWSWEPANCRLEEITADGFCRAMEGRKGLLLVGDSLTRLMLLTLAAATGARQVSTKRFASDLFLACGDSLPLMHYRNDLLDTRLEEFPSVHCVEPDHGSTRCTPFADDATLEDYDTLVVNSGAHILRGGMDAYADMMSNASSALTASMRRLHGYDALLVVRNTTPGHWNCEALMFDGPVDKETAANLTAQAPPLFEWETFLEKNEVLEEAFSAEDGWRLLDAYTPTVLRADGHHGVGEDCLHYCVPGPVDHWVTLLYNILLSEAPGVR